MIFIICHGIHLKKIKKKMWFLKAKMSCKSIASPYAKLWGRILPTPLAAFLTTIWGTSLSRWLSLMLLCLGLTSSIWFLLPPALPSQNSLFCSIISLILPTEKCMAKVSNINKPVLSLLANISPCLVFNFSRSETNARISGIVTPRRAVLGRQNFAFLK